MIVSSVVVVMAEAALYPPSTSESLRRGSVVFSLTLLMLMMATFMSPPPRSNFVTKKVLRLPNAVTFGPISTSRIVPTIIMVLLFSPYIFDHSSSEVICTALVSILVPMVQRGSVGAIASVFFASFSHFSSRVFWCLYAPPRPKK